MKIGAYHQCCRYTQIMYALCILVVSTMLFACAPRLGDSDAALALEDIASGHGASRLKARTSMPTRRVIHYTVDGRSYTGDIYLPAGRVRAGIVLVPGIVQAGKDDARLVALAHTLARMDFAVLTPDIQGLRQYKVRKSDVREVADAFRYLVAQSAWAPQGQAGIAGFSYGAGPVLIAALEADIREHVRFVFTFGGYYDLRGIVTYFTTGYFREHIGAVWRYTRPDPYIKWVFTLSNIELLDRADDRHKLRTLAVELSRGMDIDAINQHVSDLGPDARALYELLVNKDPLRVEALLAGLSEHIRTELDGIDPASKDLSRLQAQLILLHGRGDTMIPYTESIALARAIPQQQVKLYLIDGFAHVDVRIEHQDIPLLLDAMDALLKHRVH